MTSTSSGLTMLTSGVSQYLHPDYLQPLPTTLDAKKSPLALLAQTCSAIGKDSSPSKPIIPPLEKSDKMADSSDSSAPKRPNSHGSKDSNSKDLKTGMRSFPHKEIPALVPITNQSPDKSSNSSSSSSSSSSLSSSHQPEIKSRSPSNLDQGMGSASNNFSSSSSSSTTLSSSLPLSSTSRPVSRGGSSSSSSSSSSSHNNHQRSSSRSSNSGKGDGEHPHSHHHHQSHHTTHHSHHHQQQHPHRHRDSPPSSSSTSSIKPSSSPSYTKSLASSSSSQPTPVMQSLSSMTSTMKPSAINNPSLLGGLTPAHMAGYPHPLSLMSHGLDPTNPAYHSALAAHSSLSSLSAAAAAAQSSALKAAAAAGSAPPSALSPYVTYARVRTPSGATTLVPVCRDPYCPNCQLTLQNCHVSATCTAHGCSQCAHEKSLTSLSALGPLGAASSLLLPPLSSSSSLSSNLSALSSLHSLYPPSALAAAAHQGLPYTCNWVSGNDYCGKRFNSSEELLQHLRTHTSSMDSSSLAASYAGLGLPSALAAYPHFAASAPLSPNSLRRAYPTSLSPVSNLLGASRYHPYKSPLSNVPPAPQTPQNFPPVGPFFSPYTFFGQRLGAVVP